MSSKCLKASMIFGKFPKNTSPNNQSQIKIFHRKYIAILQNFVSSEAFSNNCFHWLIKLITLADEKLTGWLDFLFVKYG